jgi:hypothetical protein
MSAPYVCAYHHYQGEDPCDACEMDPARTDEDAQHAATVRDELTPDEALALMREIHELTSKDAIEA